MENESFIHIYSQLHHKDGRVENWHYYLNDIDVYLDLLNGLRVKGVIVVEIPESEFDKQAEKAFKVNLHEDKDIEGDANGKYLGYFEHYEI